MSVVSLSLFADSDLVMLVSGAASVTVTPSTQHPPLILLLLLSLLLAALDYTLLLGGALSSSEIVTWRALVASPFRSGRGEEMAKDIKLNI